MSHYIIIRCKYPFEKDYSKKLNKVIHHDHHCHTEYDFSTHSEIVSFLFYQEAAYVRAMNKIRRLRLRGLKITGEEYGI